MAERYWVGGSGLWDGSNTANWSDVTNGTGGFSVPTSSDNVYFDANSGTSASVIEVQRSGGCPCLNFSTVGFLGTIGTQSSASNQRRINIYGNCTLGTVGAFVSQIYPQVFFQGAAGVTQEITCGGQDMGIVVFNGTATTTYKFMDDFYAIDLQNQIVTHNQGIIDANNKNVFIERIQFGNPITPASAVRTVNMGTGLWTITGGQNDAVAVWDARDNVNLTINKSTANIYLSVDAGVSRIFYTGGFAYNKLTIGGVSGANGTLSILGGGSFTELASVKKAPSYVVFSSGQTTTVTKFSACGNNNNSYLTVSADAAPTQATINTVTPSGVFYVGSNSINSGNNTGVTFSSGYILDYMVIANLLVSTTRSVVSTVGYSGVANQIQTTPGNALGVVGNANNGLGNDVGGSGAVDVYSGV